MVEYLDQRIAGTAGQMGQRSRELIQLLSKEFDSGQMTGLKIAIEAPDQLLSDCEIEIENLKTKEPKEKEANIVFEEDED